MDVINRNEMEGSNIMREKILNFMEKNSRIDVKELAILVGADEATVLNELEAAFRA